MTLGIEGFGKGRSPTDRAGLEIITGRIEVEAEPSKVVVAVRDQGGPEYSMDLKNVEKFTSNNLENNRIKATWHRPWQKAPLAAFPHLSRMKHDRDTNPFPGLRPFHRDETEFYFGREQSVNEVLAKLDSCRFVAIVGPSGCGKSSLVRAGLLPAFELATNEVSWVTAIMHPGHDPFTNLAAALASSHGVGLFGKQLPLRELEENLRHWPDRPLESVAPESAREESNTLVLVDQFEEIFRFADTEAEQFVQLLLAIANSKNTRGSVIVTMRADFLGDCVRFRGLPEALNAGQYLLPRLTHEQTRTAIYGPARYFGVQVEEALIKQVITDMGAAPDQLPLMQHVMSRVWTRMFNRSTEPEQLERSLSLKDYQAVGGIARSLSMHADEVFLELDLNQRQIAEAMFRLLSEREASGHYIRRPVRMLDIANVSGASFVEVLKVAEMFSTEGRSFLVPDVTHFEVSPDTIIDISHEALLRNWSHLRDWVDTEVKSAAHYRSIAAAARAWQRGAGVLFSGATLDMAMSWFEHEHPTMAWASRYTSTDEFEIVASFLAASEQAQAREGTKVKRVVTRPPRRDKIFLSYRREDDSHAADRIYDSLVKRFRKGRIIYDVDTFPYGVDFWHFILEKLEECCVFLAVIGDHWLDVQFTDGPQQGKRRLEDPSDSVRIEIEAALRAKVPIVPVLVGRRSMPREDELPPTIRALVTLNAADLHSGPEFHQRLERLLVQIESTFDCARTGGFRSWL
jgi:hypothetical protein